MLILLLKFLLVWLWQGGLQLQFQILSAFLFFQLFSLLGHPANLQLWNGWLWDLPG
jgi:hypothetical protein